MVASSTSWSRLLRLMHPQRAQFPEDIMDGQFSFVNHQIAGPAVRVTEVLGNVDKMPMWENSSALGRGAMWALVEKKKQPDFCFHEDWVVLGSIILATPRARKGLLFWHPWLSFISSWTMKVIAIVNACWESHSWEAKSRACIDCFNEFPLQFSKITRTPHPTPMVSMENQRLKRSAFLPRFRESGSCTAEILTHLTKIRSSSPDHNFKLRSRTETRSGQQGRPV